MTEIVKIKTKGQITIPKKIREMLQMKEGTVLIVKVQEEKIIIEKFKGEI
jgi:AbrB family looped-hinge helix DNA binding protein